MNRPESPLARTRRLSATISETIRAIEALHPEQPEHRGIIVDIHGPIERLQEAVLTHPDPTATKSGSTVGGVALHAYL